MSLNTVRVFYAFPTLFPCFNTNTACPSNNIDEAFSKSINGNPDPVVIFYCPDSDAFHLFQHSLRLSA